MYTTPAPKGTLTTANKQRALDNLPKATAPPNTALPSIPGQPPQSPTTAPSNFTRTPSNGKNGAPSGIRASIPSDAATGGPRNFSINSDSPVMSETLSVIDEHITDMNTPRASYANTNKRESVSSAYSYYPLNRKSYITGHETDEEESQLHTPAEVNAWSPKRVAEYLEDQGVERSHCDVFIEQDISGEVLLAMDQNSLFIKEFELGSVGRRLKTWHKIKALQEEVKRNAHPVPVPPIPAQIPSQATAGAAAPQQRAASVPAVSAMPKQAPIPSPQMPPPETTRTRSSTVGTTGSQGSVRKRPEMPPQQRSKTKTLQAPSFSFWSAPTMSGATGGVSPLQSMTAASRKDAAARPSAQSIRNMNNSRRHSSIDSTSTDGANRAMPGHRRQPSQNSYTTVKSNHEHTASIDSYSQGGSYLGANNTGSPNDLDRGYFSSTEVESRNRKTLVKRSPTVAGTPHARSHSTAPSAKDSVQSGRQQSMYSRADEPIDTRTFTGVFEALKVATTSPFTRTPQESTTSPTSPAKPALTRTASKATSVRGAQSLDSDKASEISALPSLSSAQDEQNGGAIAAISNKFEAFRSAVTRRTSDATTTNSPVSPRTHSGRHTSTSATMVSPKTKDSDDMSGTTVGVPYGQASAPGIRSVTSPITAKDGLVSSPTDTMSTPSMEDKESGRASTGSNQLAVPPMASRRPRTKSKKMTSAYTRGLEHKTPAEQMQNCDYSGWMKKKSGSLMTTWKTRLFILRGRRLSYYYSDNDTEEKGLIDISFHRVLPAHNETLTGLHATVTGAVGLQGGSPLPTSAGTTPTLAEQDLKEHPPKQGEEDDGLFIFKLVPPKAGLSKGVNFTKPTVHYFAVNSRQEGRLWMAALMKATIDRDDDATVTTTYNQKTISLAKARARNERPPALKDDEAGGYHDGLGISEEFGDTSVLTPDMIAAANYLDVGGLQDGSFHDGSTTMASSVFDGSEGDAVTGPNRGVHVPPS